MTINKPEKQKVEKYVLCEFCKQKIHIDHWGGAYKENGKEVWFCDKTPCLIEFNNRKEND